MNKKKIIYIIFENANRELVGKLLLGTYALIKNYHVVIGEKNELRSIIKYLPPGIIIEKALRKGSNKRFNDWKKLGHEIYSLDEEALMYHDNKIYLNQNIDYNINLFINIFFLWSEKHKKMIKNNKVKKKSKIVGNPRIDILKEPFRQIYDFKAKKLIEKHGDFIFISSRFGSVNRNNPFNKLQDSKSMITTKSYFNESTKLLNYFYDLPFELRKKFPKTKIIIRTHPSESDKEWKKIAKKVTNCEVIFQGSAIPWILAAKKVIHNRDTIGLESWILKKKTICFDPFHGSGLHDKLFKKVCYICKSYSDVNKLIIKNKKEKNIKYSELDHWYTNSRSKDLSFEKIINSFDNLDIKKHNLKFSNLIFLNLINILKKFLMFFKLINKKNRYFKFYSDKKVGDFTRLEINDNIKKFSKIINKKKINFKMHSIGKRVIFINEESLTN
tara:strand:- start:2442 stop:3770 length:1329 start_codon:yes stop_codon:yes gene_type:complete